jgi:hypothetical protein
MIAYTLRMSPVIRKTPCSTPITNRQLQLEAVSEQEGEQQVELHVDEGRREPVHRLIEPGVVRRVLRDVDRIRRSHAESSWRVELPLASDP